MISTYLITGANRGIGLELSRQLRAAGQRVIATARRPEDAGELAALDVRLEELDVTNPGSVSSLVDRLAGEPIDVLINNAGYGVKDVDLASLDIESLAVFFQVNSLGSLRVTKALLPNLRSGERKIVAQMTSKMGSIADNSSGGAYGYRASKAALNAIHQSLAIDLAGEGFTCVALHPGWVRTEMGGAAAPLDVTESTVGLLRILEGLAPGDSGAFLDFDGNTIPW
jgi:NAD(P)-dependent dehydrogenase (short-subunit alcohol dehydrogenase family)